MAAIVLATSCSTGSSASSSSTSAPGGSATSQIPTGSGPPAYVSTFPDPGLANCGPGSVPETGLQGQVPLGLRQSGFKGFSCNLQLLSQYAGQGAIWVGHWYGHCFYMPTSSTQLAQNKGVAVVDVSDPTNIKFVKSLSTPGMLNTWEGLRTTTTGLLIGYQSANTPGLSGNWIDIYNIKSDCTQPLLQSSVQLGPPMSGHEAQVSPDGKTLYVGTTQSPSPTLGLVVIDISKPDDPKLLTTWNVPLQDEPVVHIHGLGISADGKIGYLMSLAPGKPNNTANGLMIVDLSQIQDRKPNPQIKVISFLPWRNNNVTQMAQEFRLAGYPGRTFLVVTDELGAGSCADPQDPSKPATGFGPCLFNPRATVCDGYDAFAFGRIVDVTDPRVPTEITRLKLQVQDPKNCTQVINDGSPTSFRYDAHYCGVDNPENATAIACGYFESGVRVFDIRDPYRPKEIAYYNPPAKPENGATPDRTASKGGYDTDPTVDWASSWSRFYHAPDGSWELWIQTQENGVQILRFTNGVYPLKAVAAPAAPAGTGGGTSRAGWIGLIALLLELVVLGGFVLRRRRATG
jgi:LVIVD repeat